MGKNRSCSLTSSTFGFPDPGGPMEEDLPTLLVDEVEEVEDIENEQNLKLKIKQAITYTQ